MPTIHLLISGKVQGVFFRVSAKKAADEMHISGWVRNTRNSDVEIMATGSTEDLSRFLEWCQTGPPQANVLGVKRLPVDFEEFEGFSIRK